MRVLVAPDKLAGTLTALEAADAAAAGWHRQAPGDVLDLAPLSDGGPGFVDVLAASSPGERLEVTVRGPFGDPVSASVLLVGETAYVESAQACGLGLTGGHGAARASTYGVGELIRVAVGSGARRVVVGLGGSGSNDGGAGLLAALGANADRPLDQGGAALAGITRISLPAPLGIEILAASDVDNPLTGPYGATRVFGPQKGLAPDRLPSLDAALQALARVAGPHVEAAEGAGAAGGLGYGLLLLGARRRSGFDLVAETVDLEGRVAAADVVLTAEGALDATSAAGKAPVGVARLAARRGRPCVALAGRVDVAVEELPGLGLTAAYSLVAEFGAERALGATAVALADLATLVAARHRGEIVVSRGE